MSKRHKVQRPRDELKTELKEQLQLLLLACRNYDSGLEASGKHIALSLRVLLHHRGTSRALLEQLGLRDQRFLDSAGAVNPRNLLTECNLVVMRATTAGGAYIPLVAAGDPPRPPQKIPFAEWWNEPVLRDKARNTFCRRELVLHVANTDGGAHVDPELDAAYAGLSRSNSLAWVFTSESVTKAFEGRPELACMRQIAEELIGTLREVAPQYFGDAQPSAAGDAPQAARPRAKRYMAL